MTRQVICVIEKPHEINPFIAAMIRRSGRSWWQARFSNGKVVSEWGTLQGKCKLPLGKGASSRWEEVSKKGMVGLRLLCPNGMVGELEAPEGHHFFQLKVGGMEILFTYGGGIGEAGHFQDAHIIGVITDSNGNCYCRAWETVVEVDEKGKTTQTIPPGVRWLVDSSKIWPRNCLLAKTIHVQGQLQYQKRIIWGCQGDRLTIQPFPGKPWETYIPNNQEYIITSLHRRLIHFEDNVFNMKYRNIGKLNLDVQGIRL